MRGCLSRATAAVRATGSAMHSRLAQGTAVLLFGIALISCKQSLDLSEVSTLAKTVASGQDALQAIPADFYDSCVRQITWSRAAALGLVRTEQRALHQRSSYPRQRYESAGSAAVPSSSSSGERSRRLRRAQE